MSRPRSGHQARPKTKPKTRPKARPAATLRIFTKVNPPELLIVDGLDVPARIASHIRAASLLVQGQSPGELAGYEFVAIVEPGATRVLMVLRSAALEAFSGPGFEHVVDVLAEPLAGERTRITVIEPDGRAYFAGLRWAQLSAGGCA